MHHMLLAAFFGLKGTWHVWIGLVLFLSAIATVLGLVVGFIVKVYRPQYPTRGQQKQ